MDAPLANSELKQIEAFEIRAPLILPNTEPCSVTLAHEYLFNNYGHPFVGEFNPVDTAECGSEWSDVILTLDAYVDGRQFDRTGAVWIGGLELLRFTTAEPSGSPQTHWSVQKQVVSSSPLLRSIQPVVINLDNIVDQTYTGIFNVSVKLDFYRSDHKLADVPDLIFPVSASTTTSSWFTLPSSQDPFGVGGEISALPSNAIKAEVEVFLSGHSNDEFWYTNVPDDLANQTAGFFGGGSLKELQIRIDEHLVAVDYPFPTIYTGGINPLLWRPLVAIHAFDVPSTKYDVTPCLPLFFDSAKPSAHRLSFNITPSANFFWFITGNLRVWTDGPPIYNYKKYPFVGKVTQLQVASSSPNVQAHNETSFQFNLSTTVPSLSSTLEGWIKRRDGSQVLTRVSRELSFSNNLQIDDESNIVDQNTAIKEEISQLVNPLFTKQGVDSHIHVSFSEVSFHL